MAGSTTLNGTHRVVEVPSNPLEQKPLQLTSLLPYVAGLTSCQVFVASCNSYEILAFFFKPNWINYKTTDKNTYRLVLDWIHIVHMLFAFSIIYV